MIDLVLTPELVCDIVSKRITMWTDTRIINVQENVTFAALVLPNEPIYLVGYSKDSPERVTFKKIISTMCQVDLSKGNLLVDGFVDAQGAVGTTQYSIAYGPVSFTEESLLTHVAHMRNGSTIYKSLNCSSSFTDCWPLVQRYSMLLPSSFDSTQCTSRAAQETALFADYDFRAMENEEEDPLVQFGMSRLDPAQQRQNMDSLACFGQSILSPVEDQQLLSVSSIWVARAMALVVIGLFGLLFIWLFVNRSNRVIKASQVIFSYQMIFGFILQLLAVFSLTLQDDDASGATQTNLDSACMSTVWLVGMGFCIVYVALVVKAYRVWIIFDNPKLKRFRFSIVDLLSKEFVILCPVLILLIAWTVVAPFKYIRKPVAIDESEGLILSSVGECYSDGGLRFLIPILVYVVLLAAIGLYLAWKNRAVPSEFSEGTHVSTALLLNFELIIILIPVLALVSENASATFIIKIIALFFITCLTAAVFFGPKILIVNGVWQATDSLGQSGERNRENSKPSLQSPTTTVSRRIGVENVSSHRGETGVVPFDDLVKSTGVLDTTTANVDSEQ